jgi:hypothetical protein
MTEKPNLNKKLVDNEKNNKSKPVEKTESSSNGLLYFSGFLNAALVVALAYFVNQSLLIKNESKSNINLLSKTKRIKQKLNTSQLVSTLQE